MRLKWDLNHPCTFLWVRTDFKFAEYYQRNFCKWNTYCGSGMSANEYYLKAETLVREAVQKYQQCLAKFGGTETPWAHRDERATEYNDGQFPIWVYEQ